MSKKNIERAKSWGELDPDPKTRGELEQLSQDEIESLFNGQLAFGTAGLRAELGPGPQRMNRVLVQLTTRALYETIKEIEAKNKDGKNRDKKNPSNDGLKIVVGYDGRINSDVFAWDAVGVIEDCGGTALLIDKPLPTPVLARSVLGQNAAAGIMVTASHNPKQDNGYKVYLSDGGQITSPTDRLVEHKLSSYIKDLPNMKIQDFKRPKSQITDIALNDYVSCLVEHLPACEVKDLKIVYTPLHGVGKDVLERVFEEFNFPKFFVVKEQAEPDGEFPTAPFPNPEEAGALDLALALAETEQADLLLANDPDADRLCVGVKENGSWRILSGNELGVLLADYCMSFYFEGEGQAEGQGAQALVATTCVSSQLLSKMAESKGVAYEETLTGFKWISRVDTLKSGRKNISKNEPRNENAKPLNFIFGYEEALGYGVLPRQIRDKDGISAAVAFVNLFVGLRNEGKTPLDRLDELSQEHGMYLTSAASIRYDGDSEGGGAKAAGAMARLRSQLPEKIGEKMVLNVMDYSSGETQRPANMISFYLEGESRIVVRPSGTEPKLKVYVELVEKDISKREQAEKDLAALTDSAAKLVAEGQ